MTPAGRAVSRGGRLGGIIRRAHPPAAVVAIAVVAVLAASVGPRPPQLAPTATGDQQLAERVRQLTGDGAGRRGLAVATITPEGVTTAGLGRAGADTEATPTTPFAIGSITKALTGMLLADLAGDGVIDPATNLQAALPGASFADATVGQADLAQLASHRSGLPRLPLNPVVVGWTAASTLFGVNPYAWGEEGADALVASATATSGARPAGEFGYSNLGGALLGQILARAADTPYPRLLRRELLDPLGMDDTHVVADGDALPPTHAAGFRANGRPVAAWRDAGYAPAGLGVWSTAADLARLAQGVLDDTAPGADAAEPRFAIGDDGRIGFGWFTTDYDGRSITWHNGATGGFRSYIGLDREAGRGVVVLSNTAIGAEPLGRALLGVDDDGAGAWWQQRTAWIPLGALAVAILMAGRFAWRRRTSAVDGDRLDLLTTVGEPTTLVLVAGAVGPWHQVTPALWWAGALAVGLAAWLAGRAWPHAAGRRHRSWLGWGWAAISLAIQAAVVLAYPLVTILR